MHSLFMPGTRGSHKRLDALELELQEIVSCHVQTKLGPLHGQEMLLIDSHFSSSSFSKLMKSKF